MAVTAVVIGTRWVWLYTMPYLIRLVDRRQPSGPGESARATGGLARSPGSGARCHWPLALAVPNQLDSGAPFPDRDLIFVITCGVIVLTLLQALFLPAVVRSARLPGDTSVDEERLLAETATTDAAYEAIEVTAGTRHRRRVVDRVRQRSTRGASCSPPTVTVDDPVVLHDDQYTALRLALLGRNAPPSFSCGTTSRSTTSCCARSRHVWTRRRCG